MRWYEGPLLGFDFETTGIDPLTDLPVQVALVWTSRRAIRSDTFLVNPDRDIPDAAVAIHGITTARARAEGCPLGQAVERLHAAFRIAAEQEIPVVAMNAGFDITIAECLFASAGLPTLPWAAVVDPLVMDRHCDIYRKGKRRLDALCDFYGVRLTTAHDAGSDAEAAVWLSRIIGDRYPECGNVPAAELTRRQAIWHHEWAVSYDSWRREQGFDALAPEEFLWPLRRIAALAEEAEAELARLF
jgi:DNA polymerase-3 subunit epsilon